jgi:hypothetical protein
MESANQHKSVNSEKLAGGKLTLFLKENDLSLSGLEQMVKILATRNDLKFRQLALCEEKNGEQFLTPVKLKEAIHYLSTALTDKELRFIAEPKVHCNF